MASLSAHAFTAGVVVALSAFGTTSADAQNGDYTRTVVVAIFKDYPVFKPSERNRAASELRAIVIPSDLSDKSRSMVILNPDYVTPEVLHAALTRLYAWSTENPWSGIIGITQQSIPERSTLDPSAATALRNAIAELLAAPRSKPRGHPTGKHIVISKELRKAIEGNTQ